MNNFDFTFSDTIQGYVSYFDRRERSVQLTTSDGRQYKGFLASNAYARIAENLDEPYADATRRLAEMLTPGQLVYAHGMFYPGERRSQVRDQVAGLPRQRPEHLSPGRAGLVDQADSLDCQFVHQVAVRLPEAGD